VNRHRDTGVRTDEAPQLEWTDVVVVGYGFAGGAAALSAADAGKHVLLLEKMAVPGGISICSGGGFRVARDAAKALEYLIATNAGSIDVQLLRVLAEQMTELPGFIARLARINGASVLTLDRPGSYPFPGYDTFAFLEVDSVPGFDPAAEYPKVRSLRAGINAFKVIDDNIRSRSRIEVRLATPVTRVLRDDAGRVCGVEAAVEGKPRRIGARHGVVLACGGFESSPAMQRRYWQLRPVLGSATRGNTGDGYRMAQALGAELAHMWHFHGSYGFRHTDPAYPFGIRSKKLPDWTPQVLEASVRMSWILVDGSGRRFMNEYQPYVHDTGHRFFDRYDPTTMRFPAVPAFMVFDEAARRMYPVAKSYINDPEIAPYDWSDDNLREVELGILKRADSIAGLARAMKVPEARLERTVSEWNALCESGAPESFGRPAATRTPVATPPFYCGEVWPVVSNTQGALTHDVGQRVLDTFGQPIPRLYVAGELGSIWGFLYLSGGNLSECLAGGRLAGLNVSSESALPAAPIRHTSMEEEK
jgi:succinate dehydrogenase/fumarate reductase flavoprotein subunit